MSGPRVSVRVSVSARAAWRAPALLAAMLVACTGIRDVYVGADDPVEPRAESGQAQPEAPQAPAAVPVPDAAPPRATGSGNPDASVRDAPDAAAVVSEDASAAVDSGNAPPAGCTAGTADCDGAANNGCETDIASDLQNCGGCDRLCHTAGHDAIGAECVAGRCQLTCRQDPFGDHDCDGDPDNGCETRLLTDNQNCGACGVRCICRNGTCL